jgi:peptide/nickel transport system substrate-binding protein
MRLALLVGLTLLATGAVSGAAGSAPAQSGNIFRISLVPQAGSFDHIDPALSFTPAGWALIDTTCARLITYPDKPPQAGFRPVPEVAVGFPKVSKDLKKYTFTLRQGFRFNDGKPVDAKAFARAINRTLAPAMNSPGTVHVRDIVGAGDVLAGRRTRARGVEARGNKLVVRLTRPAPDFSARMTLPFFCAVPPNLPPDPEGVRTLPGAGPYYIAEYRPLERVVIRRNRYYRGKRPYHVDGFDVDLRVASSQEMIQRIDRGEADWGYTVSSVILDPSLGVVAKHGVNRSAGRFFLKPGLNLRMLVFNSSRRLFRDNPRLRKAVNFALDRQAIQNMSGGANSGVLTDQYLPAAVPGFRDARVYPLGGADVDSARALASGNLRGGKAVLYTSDAVIPLALARAVKQQLAAIGLEVDVKGLPFHTGSAAYLKKLATPGENWDLAFVLWSPNIPDPYAFINTLLGGRYIGGTNVAGFASAPYDRAMRLAARAPDARERNRAYGALDVRLTRESAPLAAMSVLNEATFVSERVGCKVLRPALDLTAVCLR